MTFFPKQCGLLRFRTKILQNEEKNTSIQKIQGNALKDRELWPKKGISGEIVQITASLFQFTLGV